jgi:p-aminobenzoyl-glutamate transporter AbgT
MKKNIDLKSINLKTIITKVKRLKQVQPKHLTLGIILFVALVYLVTVLKINGLATAEPKDDPQTQSKTSSAVPKVDPKAIQQIQKLEQSNPQVHSLFNQARNNPFQE